MQNYKTRFHGDPYPFMATHANQGKRRQEKTKIMEIPDLPVLTGVNKSKNKKNAFDPGQWLLA